MMWKSQTPKQWIFNLVINGIISFILITLGMVLWILCLWKFPQTKPFAFLLEIVPAVIWMTIVFLNSLKTLKKYKNDLH